MSANPSYRKKSWASSYILLIVSFYAAMLCTCTAVMPNHIEQPEAKLATIEGSTEYYLFAALKSVVGSIDNVIITSVLPYQTFDISPGNRLIIIYQAKIFSWFPVYTPYRINIVAEPGHRYIARGQFWSKPHAWIEDSDNTAIRWDGTE